MSAGREREALREPGERSRAVHYRKLEQNLAWASEASKRQERLKQLGLPAQQRHQVQASEKNANAAAADGFFTSSRSEEQRWRIATERMRPRIPASTVERLVASGALSAASEVLQRELSVARSRNLTLMKHRQVLTAVRAKWGEAIMDDVRMDARARSLRGGEPILVLPEFERRVRLVAASQLQGVRDEGEFERRLQRIDRAAPKRVPAVAGYELPAGADHTTVPGSFATPVAERRSPEHVK